MNIQQLRDKIKQLNPLPDSAPRFSWLARRIDLRNKILNDNPEEFLTWPVVKETMFIGNGTKQVKPELEWILENDNQGFWKKSIRESSFGNPEILAGYTSGNLINQAYYLKRWENESNCYEKFNSIVEFGGGYGAMALILNRMGFVGSYTIVDLPEFLLLQEYYLSSVLSDISNIRFVNSFDDYEIDADLMIAICSLSEVDEISKNRFFEQVEFKHHLVVYQPNWDNWDNAIYFNGKINGKSKPNPYFPNHRYMVG